jgi:membrane fusion protein, copper/silver efflux system
MRNSVKTAITLVLVGTAFLAGTRFGSRRWQEPAPQRRILYYRDPMHPEYKSDRPGKAPDCGMALEPVFAGDDSSQADAGTRLRPCDIHATREIQQVIGVQVDRAARTTGQYTTRLFGRVAVDEGRVVRVTGDQKIKLQDGGAYRRTSNVLNGKQ